MMLMVSCVCCDHVEFFRSGERSIRADLAEPEREPVEREQFAPMSRLVAWRRSAADRPGSPPAANTQEHADHRPRRSECRARGPRERARKAIENVIHLLETKRF
jgi:hypothetical protein